MNDFPVNNSASQPALNKPLGEILIEAGLISLYQIEIALKEQIQEQELLIGQILAQHTWIEQTTADFFVEKWPILLQANKKKPLVYYFREAGLLSDRQIRTLVEEQKERQQKIRFHRLAVEKGWIKQATVDFFLANLFNIDSSKRVSFNKPYEILKNYIKGETNFQRTDLSQVPLMNVTLKKVNFQGSNLREADLSSSNLSNSNLKQANLTNSNLRKAVLSDVNFEQACLFQANLSEAHLERADFHGANLQEADLRDAYLFHACFTAADMRGVKFSEEYTYEVYYNDATCFDSSFDPNQAGWKRIFKPYSP
jgi:uncharacterized protein YjbI with pentapeptide repeats